MNHPDIQLLEAKIQHLKDSIAALDTIAASLRASQEPVTTLIPGQIWKTASGNKVLITHTEEFVFLCNGRCSTRGDEDALLKYGKCLGTFDEVFTQIKH